MIDIKTKFIVIFLLFNIVLFLNMFRRLKERMGTSCIVANRPMNLDTITSITNCKKKKFQCLSPNCNKPINGIFNVHLTGYNNSLDEFDQNLSAYCCKKCRDTGGCECDPTCASHDTDNLNKPYHGKNNSSLCNSYKENFSSNRENFSSHDEEYHANILPIVTNSGYHCKDGIIDPANCDCYSPHGEENYDFESKPMSQESDNCGPYRFYQCYNDPSCSSSFNAIRMGSFKEVEPKDSAIWGTNIANIITNKDFNGGNWSDEGSGFDHLYKGQYGEGVNENANSARFSLLADKNNLGWCQDICNKASNLDNNNGAWDDREELLDEFGTPTLCAQSDVTWAAKFFCRSCNMYDEDAAYWAHNDLNLARYKCDEGDDQVEYSTDITNKINWKYVDSMGDEAAQSFVDSRDQYGNYDQYGTLIARDSYIPPTTWNLDRDQSHLQFYCRAACGQELADKCHSGNPSHSDTEKIRNQCRAACTKRLPCPGILKRIASLKTRSGNDNEAPEMNTDNIEPPCPNQDLWDTHPPIPGSCKKDNSSISWKELRDTVYNLGSHSA